MQHEDAGPFHYVLHAATGEGFVQALQIIPQAAADDPKQNRQGFRPGFGVEFRLRGIHLILSPR